VEGILGRRHHHVLEHKGGCGNWQEFQNQGEPLLPWSPCKGGGAVYL
jgi:hypothetical protein